MKGENRIGEIQRTSRFALLVALTVMTVVLVVENLLVGWERWMLPVLLSGLAGAWAVMISAALPGETTVNLLSGLLMLETFYYGVHSVTAFRIAPVAIVAVMLYTLTMRRRLVWVGIVVGYATTLFRLGEDIAGGTFSFDPENIFISISHLSLLAFAGFVSLRFVSLWETLWVSYKRQMALLGSEREKINDFLINVSHEIRTPVNAVIGLSRLLEERELPEPIRRDVLAVHDAGLRIADELGDILDYTEVDMDKLAMSNEPYMLSSLLNDLMSELHRELRRGVELIVDADPALPAVLVGDRAKLKRILRHLIGNGLKFTSEGCVYVKIYARPRPYGVNLCFRVADTGTGIDADALAHISERFYKQHSGRTRSTGGLGLGLSIVSGFVRLMDGFMKIECPEHGGTIVLVSVPQAVSDPSPCMTVANREGLRLDCCVDFSRIADARTRAAWQQTLRTGAAGLGIALHMIEKPDALAAELQSDDATHLLMDVSSYTDHRDAAEAFAEHGMLVVTADEGFALPPHSRAHLLKKPICTFHAVSLLNLSDAEGEAWEPETVRFPGVRALVVDDEPTNLMVAEGLLKAYGIASETVESGPEAIARYESEDFDVVFMDHMMPGMDGVEAARRLRLLQRSRDAELLIVALTANTVSSARALFQWEGFDGFIAKPIDAQELDRTLRRLLHKWAMPVGTAEAAETVSTAETPVKALFDVLRSQGVDADTGMGYCGRDRGLYEDVLKQFSASGASRVEELESYYNNADWVNYAIRVHALKGAARMIGASDVSALAAQLEAAAKDGNAELIQARHGKLMREYAALTEAIGGALPQRERVVEALPSQRPDEAWIGERFDALTAALEDYDADQADEALSALEADLRGAPELNAALQVVREQLEAFDFNAAADAAALARALLKGGAGA